MNTKITVLQAELIDEEYPFTLLEICRVSRLTAEQLTALIDEGIIEPRGRQPQEWRFSHSCIRRVTSAKRLRQDLGVNLAGVALALDLLDELNVLRERLRQLDA